MSDFYDRVAAEFGGYAFSHSEPAYSSTYPNGNPEADFKAAVLAQSGKDSTALDVGCGDGKFSFDVTAAFGQIIGIDSSKGLIAVAEQKQRELQISNVSFVLGEAAAMPFEDNAFDIIFNRRGPSFYKEYYRLLRTGGVYIEIGIGEQDTKELKLAFGRGQNFGKWDQSRLLSDSETFRKLGFRLLSARDYLYREVYDSTAEFELFLRGVPIFEDFDSNADRKYLAAYYKAHSITDGKIELDRHRVVYVLEKL